MWIHICSFLDSTEFLNLINSSPYFRKLFTKERVLFLYKPVLEILLEKFGKQCSDVISKTNHKCKENECRAFSFLTTSRLVCKTWKSRIDKKACIWNGPVSQDNGLVHHRLCKNYYFTHRQQILKFIDHFKNTHSSNDNPFIGKYISVSFLSTGISDFRPFATEFSKILQKYGQKVCSFKIIFGFHTGNTVEPHQCIVKWLNCTPNLENLMITFLAVLSSRNDPQIHVVQTPRRIMFLKKLIIHTCRPRIQSDDDLCDWSWIERYNLSQIIEVQENLEYLKIDMVNKADIEILGKVVSPLKTLIACCACKQGDINLSQICNILSEKFSNSLENLTIQFLDVITKTSVRTKIIRDSFHERMNLPKVRKIEMQIFSPICLDFLLGMKESLEELTIKTDTKRYSYEDFSKEERTEIEFLKCSQIVKYLGFEDEIGESNIWSIFPKLRKISIDQIVRQVVFLRKYGES